MDELTNKFEYYMTNCELACQQIRIIGDPEDAEYQRALQEWQQDPESRKMLSSGDTEGFFRMCDRICSSEARDTFQLYKRVFACTTAMNLTRHCEIRKPGFSVSKYASTIKAARERTIRECVKTDPYLSAIPQAMRTRNGLPRYPISNYAVMPSGRATSESEYRVHQKIRLRDAQTSEIRNFTVVDYGDTHMKGPFVILTDDATGVEEEMAINVVKRLTV